MVNCKKWGESMLNRDTITSACCNKHDPRIDERHSLEVAARRTELKSRSQAGRAIAPILPRTTPAAFAVFRAWRRSNWSASVAAHGPLVSEYMLISDTLLKRLCKRLHICTSLDRFRIVMWDWEYLNARGWDTSLFGVGLRVLHASVGLRAQLEMATLPPAKRRLISGPVSDAKRHLTSKKEEEGG
ncbi:hypothetical protein B0J17DRAFT_723007 [Rhizoctonia solani]|nr:hypothetical protein B0J17DRAFT_723007 [Rhizoctonia solani]